jgi:hypothetical protein
MVAADDHSLDGVFDFDNEIGIVAGLGEKIRARTYVRDIRADYDDAKLVRLVAIGHQEFRRREAEIITRLR